LINAAVTKGKLLDIQNAPLDPFDLPSGASGTFNFIIPPLGYASYELFVSYDPEFE